VLLSCDGDVFVHRGGTAIKGTFGLQLNDGDEIETRQGASAEILFENGNFIQMGAGSRTQVRGSRPKQGAEPTVGDKGFENVQNFLKLTDAEGTSSRAKMRSGDKAAGIRAESPSQTRIRDGHPTFRWSSSGSVGDLRLTLYNDQGVHWQVDVTGKTSIAYLEDAPALAEGASYSWLVETTDPLQVPPLRSATAFFELLSAGETKEIQSALSELDDQQVSNPSSLHLVRASIFYSYGLVEDAIVATRQAVASDADNRTLQSILAHLYAEVGMTDEAIKQYDRLLEK
jgi:tetratricopeptide (TPR) repeat protein